MSLIFMEGFDGPADAAQLATKWGSGSGGGSLVVGRNGQGIEMTSAANLTLTVGSESTLIVGFAIRATQDDPPDATTNLLEWLDPNGIAFAMFFSDRTMRVQDDTGFQDVFTLAVDVWYYVEFKVTHSTAGNNDGSWVIRRDGTIIASETGRSVTSGGGDDTFDRLRLGPNQYRAIVFDDLYVLNPSGTKNNDFLADSIVQTIRPDGAGSSSDFTASGAPTNHEAVDEQNTDDADFVQSDTVGHRDLYSHGDLGSGPNSVRGVQLSVRAVQEDSTNDLRLKARVDPDEQSLGDLALAATLGWFIGVSEDAPGGGDWTVSEVDAAEFGYEVIA